MNKIQKEEFNNITKLIDITNLDNKSILITGANGLIGSYLIYFLIYLKTEMSIKLDIYAVSRNKYNTEKKFKEYIKYINIIEQDLNAPLSFSIKTDYIIHAASNAHPLAFSQDPVGTMKTNLLGTINLLESIKNSNCKFLFISTGEIYGNNTDHSFSERDVGSVDTKLIRACYPESKRAAETLCMAYSEQFNINVNIARLCYVYGATITETNSRADAQFLKNAINGQNIVMKSKGLQTRTYCYVADAISALLYILLNGTNREVYNVSNPNSICSVKDFAETLSSIAGVKLEFELPDEKEKKGYSKQADSILNSDKLIKLGWKPVYNLHEGLYNTLTIKKEEVQQCLKN